MAVPIQRRDHVTGASVPRARISKLIRYLTAGLFVVGAGVYSFHEYTEALLRSVSKRPLGDMRALGTALARYHQAHGSYPVVQPRQPASVLAPYLVPLFLSAIPESDGWSHPFLVQSAAQHYGIWSLGRDGKDGPNLNDGPTDNWEGDILLSDGVFLRYPVHVQP